MLLETDLLPAGLGPLLLETLLVETRLVPGPLLLEGEPGGLGPLLLDTLLVETRLVPGPRLLEGDPGTLLLYTLLVLTLEGLLLVLIKVDLRVSTGSTMVSDLREGERPFLEVLTLLLDLDLPGDPSK